MEKTEHPNRAANECFAPLGVMSVSLKHRSILVCSPSPCCKGALDTFLDGEGQGSSASWSPQWCRGGSETVWSSCRRGNELVWPWRGPLLWVVFCYFAYQNELETHNNSKILMFFGVCVYNHGLGFGLTCSFLKIHVFTFCPWKNQVFVRFFVLFCFYKPSVIY